MSATDNPHTTTGFPAAPLPPTPAPDIASAAARLGAYTWLASRLFEVVGGWVASTPDPAAKLFFAGVARRFADQAATWHERLPRLREVQRADLVRAPGPSATALTDELAQLADRNERVAALRAVLVRFDEVLADHQRNVAAVRDGSTILSIRWARSELADLLTASKTLAGPVTVGTGATGSAPIDGEISAFSVTGLALFT